MRNRRRCVLDAYHLHAKGRTQASNFAADLAQPDNAHGFTLQIRRGKTLPVMVALARLQMS